MRTNYETLSDMDKLTKIDRMISEELDRIISTLHRHAPSKDVYGAIKFDAINNFPSAKQRLTGLLILKEALLTGSGCRYENVTLPENASRFMSLFGLAFISTSMEEVKEIEGLIFESATMSLIKNWEHEVFKLVNDEIERQVHVCCEEGHDEAAEEHRRWLKEYDGGVLL